MTLTHVPEPVARMQPLHRIGRLAGDASRNAWIERLLRLGLVIRGIIYFVPGVFALEWALGRHRQPMNATSAIDVIGQQPWGRVLLVIVAVGLAGYALWGFIRAIFDPLSRGRSPGGIAQRIGFAGSAVAYLGLLLATLHLLSSRPLPAGPQADWSVSLLAHPLGRVIVGVAGLCWIFGSGLAQIAMGWRSSFVRDLALDRRGSTERRWAIALGRVGLISRGIVFTLIGVLLVTAALHLRPNSGAGLDGALIELAHQPFGRVLLGVAGLGLMTFGIYSAMCARWMRMQPGTRGAGMASSIYPFPQDQRS